VRKVDKVHLQETKLACSDGGEADADAAEHLRWCARCRSVVAEYRWLGEQVVGALVAAAEAAPVPRPKWGSVKRRVIAGRRRRVAGWRASAIASVALAVCTVLLLSSILGATVAAQLASPEAVMTPLSATVVVAEGSVTLGATPTPMVSPESLGAPSTPALGPIPTPPTPDA
jgi:hypothetical protein